MPKDNKKLQKTDDAITYVVSSYSKIKDADGAVKSRMYKLHKAYNKFQHHPHYRWQSKAFFPKCFEQVETIYSRMRNKPITIKLADVFGRRPDRAHRAELALNYQREISNAAVVDGNVAKTGLVLGKGYWKIKWTEGKKMSYPQCESVDPRNFYIDPNFTSAYPIQDAPHVIHRGIYSIRELEREGIYDNLDSIPKYESDPNDYLPGEEIKLLTQCGADEKPLYAELLEFWGQYKGEEVVIVVANRKKIVRMESNTDDGLFGFRPFVPFDCYTDPLTFYSKGVVDVTVGQQDEYNNIMNGVQDNLDMELLGMFWVDPDSNIDKSDLRPVPGGKVYARKDEVGRFDFQSTSLLGAVQVAQQINQDMQNSVGTVDYAKGQEGSRDTATGIAILSENANMRFQTTFEQYKAALREVSRMMSIMNSKYLTETMYVEAKNSPKDIDESDYIRVADKWENTFKDFIRVTKEDFDDYYVTIDITGDSASTIESQKAQAERILQIAGQYPEMVKAPEVIKKVMQVMGVAGYGEILADTGESPNKDLDFISQNIDKFVANGASDSKLRQDILQLYGKAKQGVARRKQEAVAQAAGALPVPGVASAQGGAPIQGGFA